MRDMVNLKSTSLRKLGCHCVVAICLMPLLIRVMFIPEPLLLETTTHRRTNQALNSGSEFHLILKVAYSQRLNTLMSNQKSWKMF